MNEERIRHLIRHISNKMRAKGDANMKEKGITYSQLQVLIALDHHGGVMTQKELEHELNVSHPTMVGLLRRLEKGGYVEFGSDDKDKRIKVVRQSNKAIGFKEETVMNIREMSENMFRRLDEKDKEELMRMLSLISEDLCDDKGGCI